jgi:sugar transferase (PEP-CTERM/EpsH1 system associated)
MRVLVLTHRLPYAPNRGDRLRAFHMLQRLHQRAEVELVSFVHDEEEASHVDEVRGFVSHVTALRVPKTRNYLRALAALPTRTPVTHALLDAPGAIATLQEIRRLRRPDLVFAYCSGMVRFALAPPLADIPFVLDFIDVDSRKWRDMAESARPPLSWLYQREAVTLGAFEAKAATAAEAALVVNEREARLAQALAPTATVHVLANGVEAGRLKPVSEPAESARVVFCGVMNYAPNDEGMQWFVREVWPLVRAARPDATLAIVGSDPTAELTAQCAPDPSITVTGRVADVREWLWQAAVAIAPLHIARGVQNKVLEAVAAGLPVVITDAVAGGIPAAVASATRLANAPDTFARHVLELLARTPAERRAIALSADLDALNWDATLEPLWPILRNAARRGEAERIVA